MNSILFFLRGFRFYLYYFIAGHKLISIFSHLRLSYLLKTKFMNFSSNFIEFFKTKNFSSSFTNHITILHTFFSVIINAYIVRM